MFTKNDSPELPAPIGDLVAGWGQVASDPLLSEHTFLQLERGRGIYRIGGEPINAIVTLVEASDGSGGLIEVAGASVESRQHLWDAMRSEILAIAAEHGIDPLVLIDRGGLESGETSVGAVVRMRVGADTIESVPAGERMTPNDVDGILTVINLAFRGHPENGNWTTGDLADRMDQPWFNADGFLVERSEQGVVAGFCWTKVHADGVGEIYLLAVHPDLGGQGTGKDLVMRGLAYLSDEAKCAEVIVYSAGDNEIARGLYESLGFSVDRVDNRVAIKQY
ncbi:MAG: GNAT family N-acetyltransferase [Acidimicrobiia bacterium]